MGASARLAEIKYDGRSWVLQDGEAVDTVSDSEASVMVLEDAYGDLTADQPDQHDAEELLSSLTRRTAPPADNRHSPTEDYAFQEMYDRMRAHHSSDDSPPSALPPGMESPTQRYSSDHPMSYTTDAHDSSSSSATAGRRTSSQWGRSRAAQLTRRESPKRNRGRWARDRD